MKNNYRGFETILSIISSILILWGLISSVYIFIWAILTVVFACVCKRIGDSKGIDYGFILGWFLGIIGLIIICVLPNGQDNASNKLNNKYEDLEKLQKLKDNGTITEKEFEIEKEKILK